MTSDEFVELYQKKRECFCRGTHVVLEIYIIYNIMTFLITERGHCDILMKKKIHASTTENSASVKENRNTLTQRELKYLYISFFFPT